MHTLGPFRALSYCFDIAVNHAVLAEWLSLAFAPFRLHSNVPPDDVVRCEITERSGRFAVRCGHLQLCEASPADQVLPLLIADFNRRVVATADDHVIIHSGVVGISGGAVLLPGASGSGKSTLVASAVRAGCTYGTDEHAAISLRTGSLSPLPKPIALKRGSANLFAEVEASATREMRRFFGEQLYLTARDLRSSAISGPVPINAIVFPSHRDGAALTIENVAPAEGLMMLRMNAFNFELDREGAVRLLADAVRRVPTLRLRFEHAPSAIASLIATLRG